MATRQRFLRRKKISHHIAQLPIPSIQALVTEIVAGIHRASGKGMPRQVKVLIFAKIRIYYKKDLYFPRATCDAVLSLIS